MSEREPDIEMEDDDEEKLVILEDGEEPPVEGDEEEGDNDRTKSLKAEIESLKQKADSSEALKSSFAELGDALKKSVTRSNEPAPQQLPGESDEDFWKRLEKEVWTDKTASVLKEAIRREAAKLVAPTTGLLMKQSEKIIEMDGEKGESYRKYKNEIHDFIKTLPGQAQQNPDVYEYAYGQVALRHIDEIAVMKAEKLLAERGVIERKEKKAEPTFSETGGKVASGARGKTRYVKKEWIAESERRGIPLEQIIRMRSGK